MPEFFVFMPLQGMTPENRWLGGGHFFEGLQNYMENECVRNENKIILWDFNCTLSKLILDNGLEDLWRRENQDSSEFTCYDRSFGTRSRIDRVYTDKKNASNTKINHLMVFFTDHYYAISLDRPFSKTENGKD